VVSALDEHTLYAHWSNATVAHTLTFNPCEGSVSPTSRQVNEGSAYGTLPVPTRSGYSFVGWFTGTVVGSQVTASTVMGNDDAIVYARWSASLVTVTFNPNGGSVAEATRSVKYGSQIGTLPQPHRDGMNFDGWHTAASGGVVVEATRIVTSAFTCYAHWSNGTATWTNVRYRIQLVTNGGTVASSYGELKYTKGKAKALPTSSQVTRSGYSFDGWFKKADFSGGV